MLVRGGKGRLGQSRPCQRLYYDPDDAPGIARATALSRCSGEPLAAGDDIGAFAAMRCVRPVTRWSRIAALEVLRTSQP